MVAVAILGNGDNPNLLNWQADIELARYLFQNTLAQNPLSTRCAQILNVILPVESGTAGKAENLWFDPNLIDTAFWQVNPGDPLNPIGWANFGQTN